MVILGERHLRAAVQDYVVHYHAERNHQGLDNELIAPAAEELENEGPVRCRERQGGVLKYYYRCTLPKGAQARFLGRVAKQLGW